MLGPLSGTYHYYLCNPLERNHHGSHFTQEEMELPKAGGFGATIQVSRFVSKETYFLGFCLFSVSIVQGLKV